MLIGALGYKLFLPLAPILPWLIFFMLFFTFCKINPLDLRLHKWHWVVLFTQLLFSFATYAGLMYFTGDKVLAQRILMCFIMPTATAAPIIAGKMGGSIQNLTTFTLLSNFATAIIVPATFPLINPDLSIVPEAFQFSPFIFHFSLLLSRIAPLLLGPFFSAWLLRIVYQRWTKKEFVLSRTAAQIPFYLWVASIVVLLVLSFFACLLQFGLGKLIGYYLPAPSKGRDYQDVLINPAAAPKTMEGVSSITAGQAFGQKNTSLGVWMANTYLDPMASLGAAAYIIWQNVFNSVQLMVVAHKK